MDDTMYDFQRSDVAAAHRRLPARRPVGTSRRHGRADEHAHAPASHFARHAWDESGVL